MLSYSNGKEKMRLTAVKVPSGSFRQVLKKGVQIARFNYNGTERAVPREFVVVDPGFRQPVENAEAARLKSASKQLRGIRDQIVNYVSTAELQRGANHLHGRSVIWAEEGHEAPVEDETPPSPSTPKTTKTKRNRAAAVSTLTPEKPQPVSSDL